jgi:hypothetical protein
MARRPRQYNAKAGWRTIGGQRCYFRSKSEANAARYLQWLVDRGEVVGWRHEMTTFWFDGIKRGVRSYMPDFYVIPTQATEPSYYVEVKGYLDAKSKTKLKRMAKYHPDVKVELWDAKRMAGLTRTVGPLIQDWEYNQGDTQ